MEVVDVLAWISEQVPEYSEPVTEVQGYEVGENTAEYKGSSLHQVILLTRCFILEAYTLKVPEEYKEK